MPRNRILGYEAQTRSRMIAYIVSFSLLFLLLSCLQVSFFGRLRIAGCVPDLVLVGVTVIAYHAGKYAGAIVGIGGGFLIEAIGSVGISLLPVVYMIFAYTVGHYARAVVPKRYTVYLFYLSIALFVRASVTLIYTSLTYEYLHLPSILLEAVLPECILTAVAGCILYFPIGALCRRLAK